MHVKINLNVCIYARVCLCVHRYQPVGLPAMETVGEGVVVESGLEVCVREGLGEGAWLGVAAVAVLTVAETLLEVAATVPPVPAPAPEAPAPATSRGLSSDCWMTFTPSGLLQADSLVLAL